MLPAGRVHWRPRKRKWQDSRRSRLFFLLLTEAVVLISLVLAIRRDDAVRAGTEALLVPVFIYLNLFETPLPWARRSELGTPDDRRHSIAAQHSGSSTETSRGTLWRRLSVRADRLTPVLLPLTWAIVGVFELTAFVFTRHTRSVIAGVIFLGIAAWIARRPS
jgi:hypothetical protein